jgi:uncharacterized protein YecT (DUF1311 family)
MKIKALFACGLALGVVGGALAQDWGDAHDEYTSDPEFAPSKALCRQLRGVAPPAADRPNAAQRRALAGCRSDALYYGIGMARDPVRARQCAFAEIDEHRDEAPFSGATMLMTIYANGNGAARNFDVAIHFACRVDGAPFEQHGRVSHLAALRAGRREATPFDYCDDVTSGLAAGYCTGREEQVRAAERDAALTAIAARWSPAERAAFAGLRRVHAAFVEAHGLNEVDLSGTLRGAMAIHAEAGLRDQFQQLVARLAQGRVPAAGPARFVAADARLNAAYAALRRPGGADDMGTVTADGIRDTQRAWLAYRDAMLAFAARKFPAIPRDSLATLLTEQRTAMLGELATDR